VKTDWESVYRSTYQELFRFLSWMLWDEEQAKDLAQETFARVLGRDPDNPRGLLFRVAYNLAKDHARLVVRRKRHLTLLRIEADVATEEAPSSPESDLEAREMAERLRLALDALTERDREVLLLWDAGLSYAEIAEHAGLAAGAIGTTVARAKKRLVDAHDALGRRDAALG
jgi:RNA polymerase sigma-70 factor (ECF subfamily)